MSATLVIERWKLPPPPDPNNTPDGWVDMMGRPDDYHVVLLASMGFTYDTISRQTGLSVHQIAYRLRKINSRLLPEQRLTSYNYRNGRSRTAKVVIRHASNHVARAINAPMRKALASEAIDV